MHCSFLWVTIFFVVEESLFHHYHQKVLVKHPNCVANWYDMSYKHILIIFLGALLYMLECSIGQSTQLKINTPHIYGVSTLVVATG